MYVMTLVHNGTDFPLLEKLNVALNAGYAKGTAESQTPGTDSAEGLGFRSPPPLPIQLILHNLKFLF